MNRRPVRSSNVNSVGWELDPDADEPDTGTMEVEFRSGHIYRYSNVPRMEYQALISASSVGRYFNEYVSGQYDEERV